VDGRAWSTWFGRGIKGIDRCGTCRWSENRFGFWFLSSPSKISFLFFLLKLLQPQVINRGAYRSVTIELKVRRYWLLRFFPSINQGCVSLHFRFAIWLWILSWRVPS
jgi:hypothetical protein